MRSHWLNSLMAIARSCGPPMHGWSRTGSTPVSGAWNAPAAVPPMAVTRSGFFSGGCPVPGGRATFVPDAFFRVPADAAERVAGDMEKLPLSWGELQNF